MKILIIGINYAPEIISTAVYSTGLSEFLARQGHQVKVVTAHPYYPEWKIPTSWPKYRYVGEKSDAEVAITHCPLYVPQNPTGTKRILHHLSFAISALPIALWSALRNRPDLVFVVAPSLVAAPVGVLAAKLSGAKTWLHIQDFEVEAGFATGLIREQSKLGAAARAFETWILKKFDRISSISKPMISKLYAKGISRDQVYEFRNWANLSRISPMEIASPLKAELGIKTKHVVLYSGNIANKQGLEIIPEIARNLSDREDVCFAVCGDGPMKEKLIKLCADIEPVRFFPLQPIERLNDLLGMADIHLLPQIEGAADLVLPSKLTNMLASGRPIIATTPQNTALSDEVEGCGIVTPPGDAIAAAKAITRLLDDPEERSKLGKNARDRALRNWDGKSILGRLEEQFLLTNRATTTPRIKESA